MTRLEEIKKRCEAATEGPYGSDFENAVANSFDLFTQDIPWLIAEVERLEKENKYIKSLFCAETKEKVRVFIQEMNQQWEKALDGSEG